MRRSSLLLLIAAFAISPLAPAALAGLAQGSRASSSESASPHESTDPVKKELTRIIEAQLAAFRADDYKKAFTFASEEIRASISVEQFEEMVRAGYPVIAKSSATEYGIAFDTGEEAVVNVKVGNSEKKSVGYQYHLVKQKGDWRISGVSEIKIEGLAV